MVRLSDAIAELKEVAMRFPALSLTRTMVNFTGWTRPMRTLLLLMASVTNPATLQAQQPVDATNPDKQSLQVLLQRIDQLEARVSQLEGERQPAPAAFTQSAAQTPTATQPETEAEAQNEQLEPERVDLSKTLLRIRGFGDITLHGDNQRGDTTSFTLGQLDLFVTSDISEKFKFLSEIVFEGGPDNIYGVTTGQPNTFAVDVERFIVQYSYNDYLNIAAGRYHTAIGYYNTAYHHSTWFQTTTGRPLLFQFEDRGGILPVHTVGASVSGLIPSGHLGLHYVAEVGNGRASRNPLREEPVQNVVDDQNHKAFNLALFARPEAIRGLQVGFSAYRDMLAPINLPRIGETILAAHAVYILPKFEWLNEAVLVRHAPEGLRVFNTPGFYTQISKQFGAYRPYFRYQYVNAADSEPVFPEVGLRQGPSVGLRFDASESVALKLQYDYTGLRRQPGVNGLALQVGFTF
jgi:TolA-binding protein